MKKLKKWMKGPKSDNKQRKEGGGDKLDEAIEGMEHKESEDPPQLHTHIIDDPPLEGRASATNPPRKPPSASFITRHEEFTTPVTPAASDTSKSLFNSQSSRPAHWRNLESSDDLSLLSRRKQHQGDQHKLLLRERSLSLDPENMLDFVYTAGSPSPPDAASRDLLPSSLTINTNDLNENEMDIQSELNNIKMKSKEWKKEKEKVKESQGGGGKGGGEGEAPSSASATPQILRHSAGPSPSFFKENSDMSVEKTTALAVASTSKDLLHLHELQQAQDKLLANQAQQLKELSTRQLCQQEELRHTNKYYQNLQEKVLILQRILEESNYPSSSHSQPWHQLNKNHSLKNHKNHEKQQANFTEDTMDIGYEADEEVAVEDSDETDETEQERKKREDEEGKKWFSTRIHPRIPIQKAKKLLQSIPVPENTLLSREIVEKKPLILSQFAPRAIQALRYKEKYKSNNASVQLLQPMWLRDERDPWRHLSTKKDFAYPFAQYAESAFFAQEYFIFTTSALTTNTIALLVDVINNVNMLIDFTHLLWNTEPASLLSACGLTILVYCTLVMLDSLIIPPLFLGGLTLTIGMLPPPNHHQVEQQQESEDQYFKDSIKLADDKCLLDASTAERFSYDILNGSIPNSLRRVQVRPFKGLHILPSSTSTWLLLQRFFVRTIIVCLCFLFTFNAKTSELVTPQHIAILGSCLLIERILFSYIGDPLSLSLNLGFQEIYNASLASPLSSIVVGRWDIVSSGNIEN